MAEGERRINMPFTQMCIDKGDMFDTIAYINGGGLAV